MNHSTSQNVLFDDEFLPCDDTFLFGDEKQISSFEEDNLINSNTAALPTTTASATTTSANDIKTTTASSGLVVLLKQAKGREDQFEDHFPPSLLCHPYKYDLKIIGPGVENHRQHKLTLNLVDAETLVVPNVTLPNNKKILEAVAVEQVEELNSNERVIRFTFNLCSFHFKRRSFRLELTQTVDGNTKRLFLSDPFQTFARRREHHQSLGSSAKNEAKNHTVAAQTSPSLSTAPLTPDSSNNSSESSILSSPKSEKQGVKRSIASVNSSYYPTSKSRTMQEPSSPTILNPSAAVPHYTTAGAAFNPYMFPANYAAVAAAYHQEMAQQFASMPLSYGTTAKMPMYYPPQWAAYQPQFVFSSPQSTSPISPPSNVIAHQEKTPDVLSALFDNTDKNKTKKEKQIHHTPLNFVQSQPEPTTERASLAIQLLKTLTPNERQAVNMFINSSSSNV